MIHKEPDKGEEGKSQGSRKPELGLTRGGGDDRTGESALAREFAQRALAPLISDLRGRSGQLEARRVASAIGMTMQQLSDCLEISVDSLQQSPPPTGLEARLEPFAMVIGIVRDVYGGDDKRVRTWLRTPRPELDSQNPLDTMCAPLGIQRVINFVLGAWLRNAD
jgi:hypothetical protein